MRVPHKPCGTLAWRGLAADETEQWRKRKELRAERGQGFREERVLRIGKCGKD